MIPNLFVYSPFSIPFLKTLTTMKRTLSRYIHVQKKTENNFMTLMTMNLIGMYFHVWMKKLIINLI